MLWWPSIFTAGIYWEKVFGFLFDEHVVKIKERLCQAHHCTGLSMMNLPCFDLNWMTEI